MNNVSLHKKKKGERNSTGRAQLSWNTSGADLPQDFPLLWPLVENFSGKS